MDYLSLIKQPIEGDLDDFNNLFNSSLSHTDGLLSQALAYIRQRTGKRMRPMLILLMARNFGDVTDVTQNAAVGLELLHTASLVHDDVVDESSERRGQASVNAEYDNKVAVLVGDYLLSTALLHVAYTKNTQIVKYLANEKISEDVYYQVIKQKTAALFEACCAIGALSAGASEQEIESAKKFGQDLGIIFQIRDDIFDYYDSSDIGKPTGNDMAEGKLTLPVIYALNTVCDDAMTALAYKVKQRTATADEIALLVDFAKRNGGIDYAEKQMWNFHAEAIRFIDTHVRSEVLRKSLVAYLDYVIRREK